MNLIPNEVRRQMPPLGATDGQGDCAVVHVKLFTPDAGWTWYITEFDGEDTCFGLVAGHEVELGYISLSELQSLHGPLGLPVERDLYFQSVPLGQVPERRGRQWDEFVRDAERVMDE